MGNAVFVKRFAENRLAEAIGLLGLIAVFFVRSVFHSPSRFERNHLFLKNRQKELSAEGTEINFWEFSYFVSLSVW